MSEAYEYGEDDFEDEVLDEEDRIRMEILEAETNEVWLEEPGDEDEEPGMSLNPLFGIFAGNEMNLPGIGTIGTKVENLDHEDSEH